MLKEQYLKKKIVSKMQFDMGLLLSKLVSYNNVTNTH